MMRRSIRTALVAAAEDDMRMRLPFLLAAADIDLEEMVSDGAAALEAAGRLRPDLLVADQCLPVLDGLSLAERMLSGRIVKPSVLILMRTEFPSVNRAKLEETGVVFLPCNAGKEDFRAAAEHFRSQEIAFSENACRRAETLLDELGVPAHPGREGLKYAALLCAEDERLLHGRGERLYPMLGGMMNIQPAAVERAMRHAIDAAWQSDKLENQHRIFADTVDAGRGQPTCGEMIARLADILRLEG